MKQGTAALFVTISLIIMIEEEESSLPVHLPPTFRVLTRACDTADVWPRFRKETNPDVYCI